MFLVCTLIILKAESAYCFYTNIMLLLLYQCSVIKHLFFIDLFRFLFNFQEKRAAQLKSYDVEESDIDTTHLVKESGKKKNYNIANKKQPPIIPGVKVKAEEKGKQMIFVITFYESLKDFFISLLVLKLV